MIYYRIYSVLCICLALSSCANSTSYQPSDVYSRIIPLSDTDGHTPYTLYQQHEKRNPPRDNDYSYQAPPQYQPPPPHYYYSTTPIQLPNQPPIYVHIPQPAPQPAPPAPTQIKRKHIPKDNDAAYTAPYRKVPSKSAASLMQDRLDWYDPQYSVPRDNDYHYIPVGPAATHGAVDYPFYFDE